MRFVRDDVRAGTCCDHLLLSEAESPRRRTEHGAPVPVILRRGLLLLVLHTVAIAISIKRSP